MERALSASRLRLRMQSPFFATLSMFAPFVVNRTIPALAIDGHSVHVNPDYLSGLSPAEVDGLFLHEVLHLALLHLMRRGERERFRWNVAADIVVNGIIARQPGLELPDGTIRVTSLEELPVEEVYELVDFGMLERLGLVDLLDLAEPAEPAGSNDLAAFWDGAMREAAAVQRRASPDAPIPAVDRLLEEFHRERLDWRGLLWRHLVNTPTDFGAFDRRHAWQGLYLETLEHEPAYLHVAVDTSGSVSAETLRDFLSEVRGIQRLYPHMRVKLYYSDVELHGPFSLTSDAAPPPPVGGRGTTFVPFFETVSRSAEVEVTPCVYLTDGWGAFPDVPPDRPVFWVVPTGGRPDRGFPFGDVIRLRGDA